MASNWALRGGRAAFVVLVDLRHAVLKIGHGSRSGLSIDHELAVFPLRVDLKRTERVQ
jgi:hypothetical protein